MCRIRLGSEGSRLRVRLHARGGLWLVAQFPAPLRGCPERWGAGRPGWDWGGGMRCSGVENLWDWGRWG